MPWDPFAFDEQEDPPVWVQEGRPPRPGEEEQAEKAAEPEEGPGTTGATEGDGLPESEGGGGLGDDFATGRQECFADSPEQTTPFDRYRYTDPEYVPDLAAFIEFSRRMMLEEVTNALESSAKRSIHSPELATSVRAEGMTPIRDSARRKKIGAAVAHTLEARESVPQPMALLLSQEEGPLIVLGPKRRARLPRHRRREAARTRRVIDAMRDRALLRYLAPEMFTPGQPAVAPLADFNDCGDPGAFYSADQRAIHVGVANYHERFGSGAATERRIRAAARHEFGHHVEWTHATHLALLYGYFQERCTGTRVAGDMGTWSKNLPGGNLAGDVANTPACGGYADPYQGRVYPTRKQTRKGPGAGREWSGTEQFSVFSQWLDNAAPPLAGSDLPGPNSLTKWSGHETLGDAWGRDPDVVALCWGISIGLAHAWGRLLLRYVLDPARRRPVSRTEPPAWKVDPW